MIKLTESQSLKQFKIATERVTARASASKETALQALCDAGILKKSKSGKYTKCYRPS